MEEDEDEESDGNGNSVQTKTIKDPTDPHLWCDAANDWLEDRREMLELRVAMEASLRDAEAEREKKVKDLFDLVGGNNGSASSGGGPSSSAAAAAAAAAAPSLLLPRGSVVVKVLQAKMGEAASFSSAPSRFEVIFTPKEPPRAALASLLGLERDARRWFGGCSGTDAFLEDLAQRLAQEVVKSKAFALAAMPSVSSSSSPPQAATAPVSTSPAPPGSAETPAASASKELSEKIDAAAAELSAVLFSMPKVGGGVPDAFTSLVPVDLVAEEEDEVVVVVTAGGANGGERAGGAVVV